MKATSLIAGLSLTLGLFVSPIQAEEAAQQEQRVLYNLHRGDRDTWDVSGEEVTAEVLSDMLMLHLGANIGWAAPVKPGPYLPGGTVEVELGRGQGGNLICQLETFHKDGVYIKGYNLFRAEGVGETSHNISLDEVIPAEKRDEIKLCRLKFWLEGEGAEFDILNATLTNPRQFLRDGIETVAVINSEAPYREDFAMEVAKEGNSLKLSNKDGSETASVLIETTVPLKGKEVIGLEVGALKDGEITVQVLFFKEGQITGQLTLVDQIRNTGYYEMPFSAIERKIPADSDGFATKIWMHGKGAEALIDGILIGRDLSDAGSTPSETAEAETAEEAAVTTAATDTLAAE